MLKSGLIGSVLLAALAAGAAQAQAPYAPPPPPVTPAAKGPTLALAVEMAQTAVAACLANGYKVSAVVVDSAGAVKAVTVGDGAAARTVGLATRKAATANLFKSPTTVISDRVLTDPALLRQVTGDTNLIYWAGGQPLMSGGETIGGLGVSGAPGGDKDDACVTAALAKMKGRL